jgi:hypothetical protein
MGGSAGGGGGSWADGRSANRISFERSIIASALLVGVIWEWRRVAVGGGGVS